MNKSNLKTHSSIHQIATPTIMFVSVILVTFFYQKSDVGVQHQ